MRSSADFLGLVAYLTLMYGRLPDREILAAAYEAGGDDPPDEGGNAEVLGRPHLYVVPPSGPSMGTTPGSTREAAA